MKRRHQIVHRADRTEQIGTTEQNIIEVNSKDVLEWLRAVLTLIGDTMAEVAVKELSQKGYIKKIGNGFALDV